MDAFADAGYTVLGLDYFRGVRDMPEAHTHFGAPSPMMTRSLLLTGKQDPVWKHRKNRHDNSNPDFDYEAWKRKHTAFANEAVPKWVSCVASRYRQVNPETKFACVGYCFGAPYVCDELAKETVAAGAFAHPAFLKEHHFRNIKSMEIFLSVAPVVV
jgi:dienelactone hydrolase